MSANTLTLKPDAVRMEAGNNAASVRSAECRRGGTLLVVDLQTDGNSTAYRTYGWSAQENSYVWSLGASSGMRLPPVVEATPLVLDIDLSIARVRSVVSAAVVRIFVNGRPVGSACLHDRTRLQCDIPAGLLVAGEPILLHFEHPCFGRMDFLDECPDDRTLGLCFYAVLIYPPWLRSAVQLAAPTAAGVVVMTAAAPAVLPDAGGLQQRIYHFSADVAGRDYLKAGWWVDDEGNTWAASRTTCLELPAPEQAGSYLARFDICPMFVRSVLESQRISILLSGAIIGQFKIGTETLVSIPLPPELIDFGGTLRFTFVMPDGLPMHHFDTAQPHHFLSFVLDSVEISLLPPDHSALAGLRDDDVIQLAPMATSTQFIDEPLDTLPNAIATTLGVDLPEILRHFESLGDNCSFGLAQRKGGSEVLGLLRFANTPLKRLFAGLDDEFQALTDNNQIAMRWEPSEPGEFILSVDRYRIRWHTSVHDVDADQVSLFAQQAMRLAYLRRKFYEGLSAGRKIMTISRAEPRKHPIPMPDAGELNYWEETQEPLRLAELIPLFLRLNQYAANTLLFLTRCERGRRSGTVELLAPGIMRGYVDDFVIAEDPAIRDHGAWMRVVANAWVLDHGPNASFRERPVT